MTERLSLICLLVLAVCLAGCSGKKGLDAIGTAHIIDGETTAQREVTRATAKLVAMLTRAAASNAVALGDDARCGTYPEVICNRFKGYPLATRRLAAGLAVVAAQDALKKLPSLRFSLGNDKPKATGPNGEDVEVVGRKSPTVPNQVDLWRTLAEDAAVDEKGAHALLATMGHEVGHFLSFDALAEPVTDFRTVAEVDMPGGDFLDLLVFYWSQRDVHWTARREPGSGCSAMPDFSFVWGPFTEENGGTLDGSLTSDRSATYTATGDFDGDGRGDIASAIPGCPLQFFLSNGINRFDNVLPSADPVTPHFDANDYLFSGDFNGDGRHDVAVVNNSWQKVRITLSDGAGAFHVADFAATDLLSLSHVSANQLVTGDFNGDHLDDFATVSLSNDDVTVHLSNGRDAFRVEHWSRDTIGDTAGLGRLAVRSGDFNGDGRGDFLVMAGNAQERAFVWLSNGTNRFQLQQWPTGLRQMVNDRHNSITVGDFNGDGRADFAHARTGCNWAQVFISDGASQFRPYFSWAPRLLWTAGVTAPFLMAGDFDGDGKTDFTNYDGSDGTFTMLLSLGDHFY